VEDSARPFRKEIDDGFHVVILAHFSSPVQNSPYVIALLCYTVKHAP
jgi:hypothetical protein